MDSESLKADLAVYSLWSLGRLEVGGVESGGSRRGVPMQVDGNVLDHSAKHTPAVLEEDRLSWVEQTGPSKQKGKAKTREEWKGIFVNDM